VTRVTNEKRGETAKWAVREGVMTPGKEWRQDMTKKTGGIVVSECEGSKSWFGGCFQTELLDVAVAFKIRIRSMRQKSALDCIPRRAR
jgi:hypothetical protein